MNETREKKEGLRDFIQGCASVFDLTGGTYITIPDLMNGPERDKSAIKKDWMNIGNDIKRSMSMIKNG